MSKIDATVLKDGQLAIATVPQVGDIITGPSPIDATCVVRTAEGDQLAVKTVSVGEGGGGGGGGADTSLSNLTAAGKEVAATMSMPSSVKNELSTAGASGSQYTAPADGYFYIITMPGNSTSLRITTPNLGTGGYVNNTSYGTRFFLPVSKGDVMKLEDENGNLYRIQKLYFVYAKGSEPQQ